MEEENNKVGILFKIICFFYLQVAIQFLLYRPLFFGNFSQLALNSSKFLFLHKIIWLVRSKYKNNHKIFTHSTRFKVDIYFVIVHVTFTNVARSHGHMWKECGPVWLHQTP